MKSEERALRGEVARLAAAGTGEPTTLAARPLAPIEHARVHRWALAEIDHLREELPRAHGAYPTASGVPAHVRVTLGAGPQDPDDPDDIGDPGGRFIGVAPMNTAARRDVAPADAIMEAAHAAALGLIESDPDNPPGRYSVTAYSDQGRISYVGVVDYRTRP